MRLVPLPSWRWVWSALRVASWAGGELAVAGAVEHGEVEGAGCEGVGVVGGEFAWRTRMLAWALVLK
jgi:hypothetical protein